MPSARQFAIVFDLVALALLPRLSSSSSRLLSLAALLPKPPNPLMGAALDEEGGVVAIKRNPA